MKPGRELDALIAEKVMGWKRLTYAQNFYKRDPDSHKYHDDYRLTMWWHSDILNQYGTFEEMALAEDSDCFSCQQVDPAFSPSTDMADAWEVVSRLKDKHEFFELWSHSGKWWCGFGVKGKASVNEIETAAHAICLAALKAVGHEASQ